jgi:hypothetical protein
METGDVKFPSSLLRATNLEEKTSPKKPLDCWRSNFYREDKVSLGCAAELCHMPLATFMDFAAKHGAAPLRYSFQDLEEERQSADRLKA